MKTENKNMQVYALSAIVAVALAAILIGGMSVMGFVGGTASVGVTSTVTITMPVSSVNLGQLAQSATNSTMGAGGAPFTVQNDGNVKVNLTINATDLWTTTANPTSNYQFDSNLSSEGICYVNGTSNITLVNMLPLTSPTRFLTFLNFTDSCDLAEVEISVTVPSNEPIGAKSSTVTLLATEA